MLDYNKILAEEDFADSDLEVSLSEKRVDIYGNRKGLLYMACMLAKFVMEDCNNCYSPDMNRYLAEINFDPGIDTTEDSAHLCVFVNEKSKN